jgi:hypothetical protein
MEGNRPADRRQARLDRRALRKRGVLRALGEELDAARAFADANTMRRLRRVNAVAATAFVIGGSLFAIGAALAQCDVGGPRLAAGVFLAGGVFFSTGGYTSLLQVVNGPREGPGGELIAKRWRWWAVEPGRLEWLSALVLFAGTLVFGINLLDSLIGDLSPAQFDRLVWSPDMIGCALFLVSGHLAMVEISGGWLPAGAPATSAGGSSPSTRSARSSSWSPPSPPWFAPTATRLRSASPTGAP